MKQISLKTLLVLSLALLFLLLGSLLLSTNLSYTRDNLAAQLQNHGQDAAISLAMQLPSALSTGDRAAITSIVDALYDSGYYRRIAITSTDGKSILLRDQAVEVDGAPAWFVDMIKLESSSGRADVTSGWQRLASVEVASHPGHAYRHLWQTSRATLGWTLAFWAVASLLATWVVSLALRPLEDMERLAKQVAAGRFEPMKSIPRLRELSHIGQALNQMSGSLERLLGEQASLIGNLQEDLYHDNQTGLHNRAYFLSAADAALADMDRQTGLVILRLGGLAEINAKQGRAAADWMIFAIAEKLSDLAQTSTALAGRLDGGQFAMLVESSAPARLEQLAEQLASSAQQVLREAGAEDICSVHVGAAQICGEKRSALFAGADAALRDARLGASGTYRIAPGTSPGEQDMRRTLQDAIEHNHFQLEWASVMRCGDRQIDHREAYARIPGADGVMHAAGAFVHLAENSGLIATMDELVLTRAWMELENTTDTGSVNLAAASLVSAGFADWLRGMINDPARVLLEIPLPSLLANPQALEVIGSLQNQGYRIVLDRFVPDSAILPRLRELRPYAIKVEGVVCRQVRDDAGSRALLQSLCDYAHELGIRVGATGVERDDQRTLLCELGFDTVQGQLLRPVQHAGA